MKKILTLALALVLVFAIAAPALAITGDLEDDEAKGASEVDFVELDVALFTKEPTFTGVGGFVLSEIAANKAYIVNEVCYYGVAVHFVELENGKTVPNMATSDYMGADLTITTDCMDLRNIRDAWLVDADGDVSSWNPAIHVGADNEVTTVDYPDAWGTGETYYFFGQGVVASKGVLKAEFAVDAPDLDVAGFDIYDGTDKLFNVRKINGDYLVVDADGVYVKFDVNADKEVDAILVSMDAGATWNEVKYYVPVSGGGSVIEAIGSLKDTKFADAKAAYLAVMEFFGFDYDAEGLLLDKHFERKASGLNLKDEAVIQLYTADIVVPGGVNPPKTGDAATVVGFVMIVVAMIAAGVVVSRKVRA